MYIIVGLGNPEKEYGGTRHNAGAMAADFLSERVEGVKVLKIKSYMNRSGEAIAKSLKDNDDVEKLVVIHDDLDLPLGSMKISVGRSSGGHRGVESIIKTLGTKDFIRIRIGIAPVNIFGRMKKIRSGEEVDKFVLGQFKKNERNILEGVFERVAGAVEVLKKDGLAAAMTEFNR